MYIIGYTLDELISNIGDYNIYAHYLGYAFKVGYPIHSPLRARDTNPSFSIFYSARHNKLMYKDFGTGDSGDCIQFVKKYCNLSTNKEAKLKIITDVGNNIPHAGKTFKFEPVVTQEKTKFVIEEQPFTPSDILYWSKYFITIPTLIKFGVVSVNKVYVNDCLLWSYNSDNPIYGYKIGDSVKCYRPNGEKKQKFRTNCSIYDIQGYSQLPKNGDLLIITKSLKDVMVLYELGYIAIAPGSEGNKIPVDIMANLKDRFKTIVVFYDNDIAGIKTSKILADTYNLFDIKIPEHLINKDISDLICRLKDKYQTLTILTTLLNGTLPINVTVKSNRDT